MDMQLVVCHYKIKTDLKQSTVKVDFLYAKTYESW